ncbi:hypothetical protein [Candidatus Liberibacter brunswickensis]|uniref:hypothetical protein n=1 Tax=Candidatus Liberibacter brunswickensis TaxID=1968796 RepID=UPI002FE31F06
MVDFVLVIQRAVDNLPENTPEMRFHIYERARQSVSRRLESITPRPPKEILERQFNKLETAIIQVEEQNKKLSCSVNDNKGLVISKKNDSTCKKNVFIKSRLITNSSSLNDNKNEQTSSILSSKVKNEVGTILSSKHFSCRLRDILSFPVNAQQRYNPSIFPFTAIEHDKSCFRRANLLGRFSSSSNSIFSSVQNYFINIKRKLPYFYSGISERNFFKYFIFLIVLIIMTMGLSYFLIKTKVSVTNFLSRKSLNKDIYDNKNVLSNIRPKITRRLLEDGSEVDMGPSTVSADSSSNISNIMFKNHIDKNEVITPPLERKKIEEVSSLTGESKVFINKGKGRSSVLSGKILWSLQQEQPQGAKGLIVKGYIPIINNAFSASFILKCNHDISLSVTHIMEIDFSFPQGSQDSVVDLRQISMRRTENSPSVFIDSNIFMISKNSYLISLKSSAEDFFKNSKILEESLLIDIPITYRSGQKVILTIDKGQVGTDIFKAAIMQWENRFKK